MVEWREFFQYGWAIAIGLVTYFFKSLDKAKNQRITTLEARCKESEQKNEKRYEELALKVNTLEAKAVKREDVEELLDKKFDKMDAKFDKLHEDVHEMLKLLAEYRIK